MWKCPQCGRSFARTDQPHDCGKPETIEQYIDAQDEAIRPRLRAVREAIRAAIPEAQERVSWSMPTFWKGRNLIHFAANKKHIGLYPGDEAVAAFADRLEAFDTSKGTIRLPHAEPLPLGLIEDIARWCMEKYGQ